MFYLLFVATFAIGVAAARLFAPSVPTTYTLYAPTQYRHQCRRGQADLAFRPGLRAYENGYVQGYETTDGRAMREGSSVFDSTAEARAAWRAAISKATRSVEEVDGAPNRFGQIGTRFVGYFPGDNSDEERTRILWYGGGDTIFYIDAPDLQTAYAFERLNAYAQ